MRTETEMLTLIKNVALQDDNIRAAYIEGSRTNPEVLKDIFQDYDIVYIVNSTKPYRKDKKWVERFGEILYMHYPKDNFFIPLMWITVMDGSYLQMRRKFICSEKVDNIRNFSFACDV